MPKASEHKTKAEHNRQFLDGISRDGFPDWVAVAAFYTAVHLVERVRAASGDGHSEGHDERMAYVGQAHGEIHTAYHILQNASMLARYQSRGDFFAQFQPDEVQQILVEKCLGAIENYVTDRLGS